LQQAPVSPAPAPLFDRGHARRAHAARANTRDSRVRFHLCSPGVPPPPTHPWRASPTPPLLLLFRRLILAAGLHRHHLGTGNAETRNRWQPFAYSSPCRSAMQEQWPALQSPPAPTPTPTPTHTGKRARTHEHISSTQTRWSGLGHTGPQGEPAHVPECECCAQRRLHAGVLQARGGTARNPSAIASRARVLQHGSIGCVCGHVVLHRPPCFRVRV